MRGHHRESRSFPQFAGAPGARRSDQPAKMDVQETTAACPDAFAELASPAWIHDPYPFMRWLREYDPVHRAASGLFLLSRHADTFRIKEGMSPMTHGVMYSGSKI